MQFLEGETLAARLARADAGRSGAARGHQIATRSPPRTGTASSTETSSQPTSCSRNRAPGCSISESRATRRSSRVRPTSPCRARGPPRRSRGRGRFSAPSTTCRPSSFAADTPMREATSMRWAWCCTRCSPGRRPFDAADTASLIAAILEREPPHVDRLGTLSPRLERALRTALEKDPEDRWQSSRDLRRELQWLAEEASGRITRRIARAPEGPLAQVLDLAGGASLAALALAALGAWAWLGGGPDAAAPSTPVIVLMDSPHPARVYHLATLKVGGTNADDLTDLLRDSSGRPAEGNDGHIVAARGRYSRARTRRLSSRTGPASTTRRCSATRLSTSATPSSSTPRQPTSSRCCSLTWPSPARARGSSSTAGAAGRWKRPKPPG